MKKSLWLYLLLCVLLLPATAHAATYHYALIGAYNNWNCNYSGENSIRVDGTIIITKTDSDPLNVEFGIEGGKGNFTGTINGFDPKGNRFKIVRFTETGEIDCVYPNGTATISNIPEAQDDGGNWVEYSKYSTSEVPSSKGGFVISNYELGNKYVFRLNPNSNWAQTTKVATAEKYTIGILSSSNSWTSPVYSVLWNSAYGNVAGGDNASAIINGVKLPDGYFKIVKIDSNNKIVAIFGGSVEVNADDMNWSELFTNPARNEKGEVPNSSTGLSNNDMGDASKISDFDNDKQYTFFINPVSGYVGIEEEVLPTADYTFGLIGEYNNWSTNLKNIRYVVTWNEGDEAWDSNKGWNAVFNDIDPEGTDFKVVRFNKNGIIDAVYGLDTSVGGDPQIEGSITPVFTEDGDWKRGSVKTGTLNALDVQTYSAYKINGYKDGNTYRFSLNPHTESAWFQLYRPSNVKVYFVDRAGWNNIHCYNYTDRNVTNEGGDAIEGDYNAKIPGVKMTRVTDPTLIAGIAGDYPIYEIYLPENYNADGTFEFPKLLFSNGTPAEHKTRNLLLVNGGIYTNASSDGEITENEYLPRQFYNYWESEKEVMAYPNIISSVKTNVIYVDVPEFYDMAKSATGEKGVAIQIEFQKDGKNFVATGRSGLHTLVPVEINGHKFLRVEFSEDVIPNGIPVKLSVWENTNGGFFSGSIDITDATTTIKNGDDPKLLEGKTEGQLAHDSSNTDGSVGSHLWCHQSHCSLNFANVIYQDGAVYSRSTTQQNIREIVQPDRFYIVNRGDLDDFINTGLTPDANALITYKDKYKDTNAVALYRVNRGEGYGDRLVYEISHVLPSTQLSFVAAFDNIENGEVKSTEWYTYAYANLGENNASMNMTGGNLPMLPGNHYRFYSEKTGFYSIDTSNSASAHYYDITVEWMNSTLYITPVKRDADFQYGQKNEDETFTPTRNGYHTMFAVEDTSDEWEKVHIFHDPEYGLRNEVKVTMSRKQEWDKYFNGDAAKSNKPAKSEDGLKLHEDSDNTIGHSTANVRAYTAGICLVTVAQTDVDEVFHRSDLQVPVRVIPTPMSIGFSINFEGVREAKQENGEISDHYYMDSYTAENPTDGSKPFEYIDYIDKNKPELGGTVFSPTRMGFFPKMAYSGKIGNEETMQLYWRYMTDDEKNGYTTAAYADESVVEVKTVLDVNSDPYANEVAKNGLLRYTADKTKHNSDLVDANGVKYQEVMTANKLEEKGGIVLQIKQNGINSPAYFIHLAKDATPTDVEEIEAAGQTEAVYYDLNGVKVNADSLVKGVYVKVCGGKAEKIFVK